jgi:hypothetical protein
MITNDITEQIRIKYKHVLLLWWTLSNVKAELEHLKGVIMKAIVYISLLVNIPAYFG